MALPPKPCEHNIDIPRLWSRHFSAGPASTSLAVPASPASFASPYGSSLYGGVGTLGIRWIPDTDGFVWPAWGWVSVGMYH